MYKDLKRGVVVVVANEQRIKRGALCLEKKNNY